ncbi:MAG TPA: hypothetical protein VGL59_17720 [Polyangia bacterium]|jgi:hypothetical protein
MMNALISAHFPGGERIARLARMLKKQEAWVALAIVLAFTACSSNGGARDAAGLDALDSGGDVSEALADSQCLDGEFAYVTAGCGANAPQPVCIGDLDACFMKICTCTGKTVDGCWANEPWDHAGACADGGDGDRPIDSPADAPIDSPADGSCPIGQSLLYLSSGCGASAPQPMCVGAVDACAGPVCTCSGRIVEGCGYATEPWISWGTDCVKPDAGPESDGGPTDADASETF